MTVSTTPTQETAAGSSAGRDWLERAHALGPALAGREAALEAHDGFVAENFADLKAQRFFSAAVPAEYGGGGLTHAETGEVLRALAAHGASTALALAMHQHLVAAAVWRDRHGQPGEALLRRVAAEELVMISTGGHDWLASSGDAVKVDGGYRVNAQKAFASGSPAGDVLVSSVAHQTEGAAAEVLHFSVPFSAAGVRVVDDWHTLGMRGTGSHTVVLEDVFVPDAAVSLRRPRGTWHPVWGVVLGVAMPLIMAVYVGASEAAAAEAERLAARRRDDPVTAVLVGEMRNELVAAQLALRDMFALANDYDFTPTLELADAILARKTLCARAALAAAEKSLEVAGGRGYYRAAGVERRLRDVHAAQFHPLPEKQQQLFSGRIALGLDPVAP